MIFRSIVCAIAILTAAPAVAQSSAPYLTPEQRVGVEIGPIIVHAAICADKNAQLMQQAADMQKRIDDLTKQIDDLKNGNK